MVRENLPMFGSRQLIWTRPWYGVGRCSSSWKLGNCWYVQYIPAHAKKLTKCEASSREDNNQYDYNYNHAVFCFITHLAECVHILHVTCLVSCLAWDDLMIPWRMSYAVAGKAPCHWASHQTRAKPPRAMTRLSEGPKVTLMSPPVNIKFDAYRGR